MKGTFGHLLITSDQLLSQVYLCCTWTWLLIKKDKIVYLIFFTIWDLQCWQMYEWRVWEVLNNDGSGWECQAGFRRTPLERGFLKLFDPTNSSAGGLRLTSHQYQELVMRYVDSALSLPYDTMMQPKPRIRAAFFLSKSLKRRGHVYLGLSEVFAHFRGKFSPKWMEPSRQEKSPS